MSRHDFLSNIQDAAGMFTSMTKPWEQDRQQAVVTEMLPDTPRRSVVSAVAVVLATWVSAVKAVLPDGFV